MVMGNRKFGFWNSSRHIVKVLKESAKHVAFLDFCQPVLNLLVYPSETLKYVLGLGSHSCECLAEEEEKEKIIILNIPIVAAFPHLLCLVTHTTLCYLIANQSPYGN